MLTWRQRLARMGWALPRRLNPRGRSISEVRGSWLVASYSRLARGLPHQKGGPLLCLLNGQSMFVYGCRVASQTASCVSLARHTPIPVTLEMLLQDLDAGDIEKAASGQDLLRRWAPLLWPARPHAPLHAPMHAPLHALFVAVWLPWGFGRLCTLPGASSGEPQFVPDQTGANSPDCVTA